MIKQKILLVGKHDISRSGGVESTLRMLSQELNAASHEVGVLYFDRQSKHFKSFRIKGIQYFVAPVRPSKIPYILFRNYRKAAREAVSVIFQTFVPDQIWSRYAIATWGIISSAEFLHLKSKIIHIFPTSAGLQKEANLNAKSDLPIWVRPKHYLLGALYYYENKKADAAILNSAKVKPVVFSQNMLKQLSEECNFLKEKIYLVRPGIDLSKFNRASIEEDLEEMRAALPFLPDKYALYVGRLEDNKKVDFLIKSFQTAEDINLVIVGDGAALLSLMSLVKELNMEGRVFFTGKQSLYLKALYTRAELLVLPSYVESFGMVLLESLACGTPVIAFGGENFSTAANEIIKDEANGILVKELSTKALLTAIYDIKRKDEATKAKDRIFNENYIRNEWDQEKMVERLLEIGKRNYNSNR